MISKIAFSLLLFSSTAFATEAPSTSNLTWSQGWQERGQQLIESGWDQKGKWILGVGSALSLIAIPLDDDLHDQIKVDSKLSEFSSKLGGGVPAGSIALAQLVFDFDNGVAHTEALVYTTLTHTIAKYLIQRRRPDRPQRESFFSGHTAHSFAAATSLAYAYGWQVGVPSMILASLVGASRLSDGVHYTSDVLFGAMIGLFWGHATRSKKDNNNLKPYFDLRRGIVGWEWSY